MKVLVFLLSFVPVGLFAQSAADKKFVEVEQSFFENCTRQFPYVAKVYSSKYSPTVNSFIPSTMELFIVVKDDVANYNDILNYVKAKRSDLNEITGRYTTIYTKNYESQLQILLYVLTPKCLSFTIL